MVYIRDLSPELEKLAALELHEDPERRKEDIERIREWLKKQPHINARTDDWNILRFLRGCKFSLEKTKSKLDVFYTCKTMLPEWYANRDPESPITKSIFELGEMLPLPNYDKKGRRVSLVRPGLHDPSKISMDEVIKAMLMVADILLDEDSRVYVTGFVEVVDMGALTASHALQMTPSIMKKVTTLWQEGYPMRPQALHYINTPASFEAIFNLFKSFLKDKIKKRIHIHGHSIESMQEAVGKDVLPIEYGGTNGSVETIKNDWVKRMMSKRKWLLEDEKYKVDESKRPGKPKTTSDLFGLEGSFRKLNVD